VHVGLIRATSADPGGNLSMENEGLIGEVLPIAQAARNHGGMVIAQVERLADFIAGPKSVRVPGILVDFVVLAEREQHAQTFGEQFNQAYVSTPDDRSSPFGKSGGLATLKRELQPLPFSERKIIGRRALKEIRRGDIVNLGIGLPETVAAVAAETGRLDEFTLTLESGPIGGVPASGLSFGCSYYPEAIIDQPSQFDFYDGGGLDLAVLGAVEVDADGSVNVSTYSGRFAGVGGFVNIAQAAKRVVFCCTFRAGDLKVAVEGGALRIVGKGRHAKFVKRVQQVCFHGPSALARGQQVLYVTERAVFALAREGLRLIEVAPGIEPARDILPLMEFAPAPGTPRLMPGECFATN
jgi:propionate CoA-transferase